MAAHSDRDLKHTIKFRDLHTADRGERVGMLNDDAVAPHGHSPDYVILSGEWEIGRIYEVRGAPPNLKWFWSLGLHGPQKRSDRVASLEEAKAQLRASWDQWKAWAKLEEVS